MSRAAALLCILALAGCDAPPPARMIDQCLRVELFKQCMAALPAGPVATQYNDWDEVVSQCDSTSAYQAYRATAYIKPECRP